MLPVDTHRLVLCSACRKEGFCGLKLMQRPVTCKALWHAWPWKRHPYHDLQDSENTMEEGQTESHYGMLGPKKDICIMTFKSQRAPWKGTDRMHPGGREGMLKSSGFWTCSSAVLFSPAHWTMDICTRPSQEWDGRHFTTHGAKLIRPPSWAMAVNGCSGRGSLFLQCVTSDKLPTFQEATLHSRSGK